MFGLFKPKPPISVTWKAWTEQRMQWLAERLGARRILEAPVLLPTDEFFPGEFNGEAADVQRLLTQLGEHTKVNTSRLKIEVGDDERTQGAAVLIDDSGEQTILHVHESIAGDRKKLLDHFARTLAYEALLREGQLTGEDHDTQIVCDLFPVFLGAGPLSANRATAKSCRGGGTWQWWNIGEQNQLPPHALGYALALFAWVRREDGAGLTRHLSPDVADVMKEGLRYLKKTEDSLFTPDNVGVAAAPSTLSGLIRQLEQGSDSFKVAALWELADMGSKASEAAAGVAQLLHHRAPEIRGEAAKTLGRLENVEPVHIEALLDALEDRDERVRASAVLAVGMLRPDPARSLPILEDMLEIRTPQVTTAVCAALASYGREAETSAKPVFGAYRRALVECQYAVVELIAETLIRIHETPEQFADDLFGEHDDDLRENALKALRAAREGQSPEGARADGCRKC
jgi:hypothetical protein